MAKRQKNLMHVSALVASIETGTPSVVLLVGAPASGKSTISTELENANYKRLSMDDIRAELYGDAGIIGDGKLVKKILVERYDAAIAAGQKILLDNTNCFRPARKQLIDKALAAGYDNIVLMVMRTPLRTCLARNKKRDRVVAEKVIRQIHSLIVGSNRVLPSEGKIVEVRPGPDALHVDVKMVDVKTST